MDTGLKTARGAKISVHFGKIVTTNLWNGEWRLVTDMTTIELLKTAAKSCNPSEFEAIQALNPAPLSRPYVRGMTVPSGMTAADDPAPSKTSERPAEPVVAPSVNPATVIFAFRKFFSEFRFNPNARFYNTLARCTTKLSKKAYIIGYAKLINHPETVNIQEKIKCTEFDLILNDLEKIKPSREINSRLDIFFGDAGTGKTTEAINQYPDAPVITCNASMLPDELLRTFDFEDASGHPVFKKSDLRVCMEEGKPIILDEINLLNFDCLRLLQTLTDSKNRISYNGDVIEIQPGFKVIGTMNLVVNEQVFSLPEPLVDRAAVIKEFTLSDAALAKIAF